jgi:hypothetical protein
MSAMTVGRDARAMFMDCAFMHCHSFPVCAVGQRNSGIPKSSEDALPEADASKSLEVFDRERSLHISVRPPVGFFF